MINKNNKNINKRIKGFTLIEILISLALFSFVLMISGSVIVSVIDINKRGQAVSSVVNNLNYSIDSMIRDIKTGYLYKCNSGITGTINVSVLKSSNEKGDCDNGGTNIMLISTISGVDTVVKYEFIHKTDTVNGYIKKTIYKDDVDIPLSYSITDKVNVNIENMYFRVKNPDSLECSGVCSYGQPSVFLSVKGLAGNTSLDASKFFLQTFISQRLINLTDYKNN